MESRRTQIQHKIRYLNSQVLKRFIKQHFHVRKEGETASLTRFPEVLNLRLSVYA